MKHISIIVPKGQYSIVNIMGSFQILNWANDVYLQQHQKPLFSIELVGLSRPSHDTHGVYSIVPMKEIKEVKHTHLIIVPAVHEEHSEALRMNEALIDWLKEQHAKGAEIAAYCIGVFLLAQTGLLDGKTCSTHWGEAEALQEMFPEVQVQSEKIITENAGLYTSGGAYAFTNLVIYLIEKYGGRELAIMTAKAFMIDVAKTSQSVFTIFRGQKHHDDDLVLKVQQMVEKSFEKDININDLSDSLATSRRTLERRFRAATGNSIIQYLQRVRVESAKKILEQPTSNVADAMYSVGYNDQKAFRELFKKYVGITPMEYKKKFTGAVLVY